ncbi:hypothetical protein [Flavobacterium sp. ACN6]|uniref:hypothetical protein n=1 Tax=Flavobacterium sp. ACN6 TaxID=1920426 RepID=UPI000BB2D25B|nr:hypothetical protein [Flavobacterium sp. ACN6]PBJ15922.1 hypothetical protein BSF42_03260 [Flavobacterium sp. ACN6]
MTFQNYFYASGEFSDNMTSYEEQLLLNYEDYREAGYTASLSSSHYNLELGDRNDEIEDNFDSEFDWDDENLNDKLQGEYDKNEEHPGTFQMKN